MNHPKTFRLNRKFNDNFELNPKYICDQTFTNTPLQLGFNIKRLPFSEKTASLFFLKNLISCF